MRRFGVFSRKRELFFSLFFSKLTKNFFFSHFYYFVPPMDNTGEEIQKKWKSYSNFHNKLGRRTSEVNSKLKITFERRREWVSLGGGREFESRKKCATTPLTLHRDWDHFDALTTELTTDWLFLWSQFSIGLYPSLSRRRALERAVAYVDDCECEK